MSNLSSKLDNRDDRRDKPSFICPKSPKLINPWKRGLPNATNLMNVFEESVFKSNTVADEYLKVYLRIRPISEEWSNTYNTITDEILSTRLPGRKTINYKFSHIFGPNRTQDDVFDTVVKSNIHNLIEGNNFTLMTYGASGSGKTFTLIGDVPNPGLIPRTLEYLFRILNPSSKPTYKPKDGISQTKLNGLQLTNELNIRSRILKNNFSVPSAKNYKRMTVRLSDTFKQFSSTTEGTQHCIWVSFVEIYNEAIFDLLTPTVKKPPTKMKLCEDHSGNVFVKDLTQVYVRSGTEAYKLMLHGQRNATYAATGVHSHSSRSHCIFTITLISHGKGEVKQSRLRLCDLAGAERAGKTLNTGTRMQESCAINTSLHVLERCIRMLRRRQMRATGSNSEMGRTMGDTTTASNDTTIVPFRESKLTRLLSRSLSGGEAATMVVTINPQLAYRDETQHVLQLSAVARQLVLEAADDDSESNSTNERNSDLCDRSELEPEIMSLRHEVSRLRFEVQRMESIVLKMQTKAAQSEMQSREDRKKLNKALQNNAELEETIEALKQEVDEYQDDLTGMTKILEQKNAIIASLKGEPEETQSSLIRESVRKSMDKLKKPYVKISKSPNSIIELDSSSEESEIDDNKCNSETEEVILHKNMFKKQYDIPTVTDSHDLSDSYHTDVESNHDNSIYSLKSKDSSRNSESSDLETENICGSPTQNSGDIEIKKSNLLSKFEETIGQNLDTDSQSNIPNESQKVGQDESKKIHEFNHSSASDANSSMNFYQNHSYINNSVQTDDEIQFTFQSSLCKINENNTNSFDKSHVDDSIPTTYGTIPIKNSRETFVVCDKQLQSTFTIENKSSNYDKPNQSKIHEKDENMEIALNKLVDGPVYKFNGSSMKQKFISPENESGLIVDSSSVDVSLSNNKARETSNDKYTLSDISSRNCSEFHLNERTINETALLASDDSIIGDNAGLDSSNESYLKCGNSSLSESALLADNNFIPFINIDSKHVELQNKTQSFPHVLKSLSSLNLNSTRLITECLTDNNDVNATYCLPCSSESTVDSNNVIVRNDTESNLNSDSDYITCGSEKCNFSSNNVTENNSHDTEINYRNTSPFEKQPLSSMDDDLKDEKCKSQNQSDGLEENMDDSFQLLTDNFCSKSDISPNDLKILVKEPSPLIKINHENILTELTNRLHQVSTVTSIPYDVKKHAVTTAKCKPNNIPDYSKTDPKSGGNSLRRRLLWTPGKVEMQEHSSREGSPVQHTRAPRPSVQGPLRSRKKLNLFK